MCGRFVESAKRLIKTYYGLSVVDMRPLNVPQWNEHFEMLTDCGRRCLKRYKTWGHGSSLEYEEVLYSYLSSCGLRSAIIPERAHNGRHIVIEGDSAVALLPWISSIGPRQAEVSDSLIASGARSLAEAHHCLRSYRPGVTRPSLDLCFMDARAFEAQVGRHLSRLRRFMQQGVSGFDQRQLELVSELEARVEANLTQLHQAGYEQARQAWPGVVHGEFRPANLSVVGDSVHGILDWNRSFVETRLHDICFAAVSFSGEQEPWGRHCGRRFQLFLSHYDASFPLCDVEWRVLPFYIENMALRWTLASWRYWQFDGRYTFLAHIEDLLSHSMLERTS